MALENRKNPVLDKLARAWLASSCLAGAAGIANASSIIIEGVPPAPALFPTSAPGYLLPVGTTEVTGAVCNSECGEDTNWFEFQGLLPASSFTISPTSAGGEGGSYQVFNTALDFLGGCGFESGCNVTDIVPANGKLEVETLACECGIQPYQLNLTASLASTPEPSTLPTVGLALAGALAWRRRRTRVN